MSYNCLWWMFASKFLISFVTQSWFSLLVSRCSPIIIKFSTILILNCLLWVPQKNYMLFALYSMLQSSALHCNNIGDNGTIIVISNSLSSLCDHNINKNSNVPCTLLHCSIWLYIFSIWICSSSFKLVQSVLSWYKYFSNSPINQ